MKRTKSFFNLALLALFAVSGTQGLMQELFVPYDSVSFDCELDSDVVRLYMFAPPQFPQPSTPVYLCLGG